MSISISSRCLRVWKKRIEPNFGFDLIKNIGGKKRSKAFLMISSPFNPNIQRTTSIDEGLL
ncbi:hypothetical protein EDB75_05320 [Helicobacter pylori]|nr:hypothetical protein EDB75_05320 [Helicobacter pylori]